MKEGEGKGQRGCIFGHFKTILDAPQQLNGTYWTTSTFSGNTTG